MAVDTDGDNIIQLSNLIERMMSLRDNETLCWRDRMLIVRVLEAVRDYVFSSDAPVHLSRLLHAITTEDGYIV